MGTCKKVTEFYKLERTEEAARDTETSVLFTGNEPVSMNMWGFGPEFFDILEQSFRAFLDHSLHTPKSEFGIPAVVDELINNQDAKVHLMRTCADWFGVTYPEDKPLTEERISELVDQGAYSTPLWETACNTI